MNTLRWGLGLITIVGCVAIYQFRFAKTSVLENVVKNRTLFELQEDSDLENVVTNRTLVEQIEAENSETENVVTSSTRFERMKRSIVNYGGCPTETPIKLKVLGQLRCLSCEEYSELTGNDC